LLNGRLFNAEFCNIAPALHSALLDHKPSSFKLDLKAQEMAGGREKKKTATEIACKIVVLLAGPFFQAHPTLGAALVPLLMHALLPLPVLRQVSDVALEAIKQVNNCLFGGAHQPVPYCVNCFSTLHFFSFFGSGLHWHCVTLCHPPHLAYTHTLV
jgi:hypothetical protein